MRTCAPGRGIRLASIAAALVALMGGGASSQTDVFNQKPEELYPLLASPQVQKELLLTSTQLDKIQARQEEIEALEEPKDDNGDTRELTEEELPAVIAKQNVIKKAILDSILLSRQRVRLRQVLAQMQGATALMQPPVLKVLEVTEPQEKAMQEARKSVVEEISTLREQSSAKNLTEQQRFRLTDKLQTLQSGMVDKMVAVLTPPQQQKWRELVGPKFALKLVRRSLEESSPRSPANPSI